MDRQTIVQLKDQLLKRLVSGEIEKPLYDQILKELDAASAGATSESGRSFSESSERSESDHSETGSAESETFEFDAKNLGRAIRTAFGSFFDLFSDDAEAEKRRLGFLTILVFIHAVFTISAAVLLALAPKSHEPHIFLGMIGIVCGIVMIEAGRRLKERRSFQFVWWCMFLILAPLFVYWPLGLFTGIFGLIVLSNPNIEAKFVDSSATNKPANPPKSSNSFKETREERNERKRLQKYQ